MGAYTTTPRPYASSKSNSRLMGSSSGLAERLHAKEYNSAYGAEGCDKHADFVIQHLSVLWLGGALVNHLEHGDLLHARPLPRAWRLTNGELGGPQNGPSGRNRCGSNC